MIVRTFEEATGVIQVVATGAWTFLDIERHYVALREMIAALRDQGRPVRVLSDLTGGQRQADWIEDYVLEQMQLTFRAGDRVALLVEGETDETYLQDKALLPAILPFTARAAAECWLARPEDRT